MNLSSFSGFNLKKLKQRDITLIILVLTAILGVVWYFYMFSPTRARIMDLDSQIESLQAEVAEGERAKANLPLLEEDLIKAKQARDDFLAELPRESEVASIIDSLRLKAMESNLKLNSINRGGGGGIDVENIRSIGFSIATEGNFASTLFFLNELQNLKRFTKVQNLDFAVQSEGIDDPILNTNYSLNFFVYTGSAGVNP